jgi:hypothetical protein
VAQATAVVVFPVGAPVSYGKTVLGEVGVTPMAAGLPMPMTVAAAVTREIVTLLIMARCVDAVLISKHAAAVVIFDVLSDIV